MIETIPEFPDFRLFTINDIGWYYDFYLKEGLNPYVDINPENLFVWLNTHDDLMISKLNNSIVIRYTNILNNNRFNIMPLANTLDDSIIERIMSYLKDNNLPLKLYELPSKICHKLSSNKWLIEDDRDNYEYILDTNQQSMLQGGDFCRHRKNIKLFERIHSTDTIDVKYYEEFNDETKEAFLHHINSMPFNSNSEASQKNSTEPIAIRKNLEYASILHKKALIIRINGEVVSLAMISYLDNNTAAINHLKVNYSVQNIFRYTVYQLAIILKEHGIGEMNIEQDLGIEGIRKFKELLRPSRFLEKKIISPNHQ